MNDIQPTHQREPAAPAPREETVPNPWSIALREARLLLLFVVLIATTYMLFAVDAPNLWFKRRAADTAANVQPPFPIDTPVVASRPVDTLPAPPVTPVDTQPKPIDTIALPTKPSDSAVKALAQHRLDSIKKQRQLDSIARAMNATSEKSRLMQQLGSMKEINTEMTKKAFDLKAPVIWLDARPEYEFAEGHIPGARNFYGEQWRSHIPELLPFQREQIIVYCGGGDCELSHDLADGLRSIGFQKVVVYTGGTKEWTAKGYPMVK